MPNSKEVKDATEREARAHAKRAQALRARVLAMVEGRGEAAPRDRDQEEADAWVREGVHRLAGATVTEGAGARTTIRGEHVVLMAATHGKNRKVGVGSSVRCEAMEALNALGRLVAEVNEAFARQGIAVKCFLRMAERRHEAGEGQ